MQTVLSIQVFSTNNTLGEEIEFFTEGEWSKESENQLIQKLHQLFTLVRPMGETLRLQIDMHVNDISTAVFLIKKSINNTPAINTQKLSVREIEVLGLIMQGYTNNDIAEKLFISFETVRSHRKNILLKTGAKNTASLINYYHQTFFDK